MRPCSSSFWGSCPPSFLTCICSPSSSPFLFPLSQARGKLAVGRSARGPRLCRRRRNQKVVSREETEAQAARRPLVPCTLSASLHVLGSAHLSLGIALIGHFLRAQFAIYVKSNSQKCPFFLIRHWQ